MKNKSLIKKIVITLVIVILLGVLYAVFFRGGSSSNTTSSLVSQNRPTATTPVNAPSSTSSVANTSLITLLGKVSTITLNDDIFSNPAFRVLQDISIAVPEPTMKGRRNPFAAISAAETSASQTPVFSPPSQGFVSTPQ